MYYCLLARNLSIIHRYHYPCSLLTSSHVTQKNSQCKRIRACFHDWFIFAITLLLFLFLGCCYRKTWDYYSTITTYVTYWHYVPLRTMLALIEEHDTIIRLFVTQRMKQQKLHILNHFAYADLSNIISAFFVLVIFSWLFVAMHF